MNTNKIHFSEWERTKDGTFEEYDRIFYLLKIPILKCRITKNVNTVGYLPIVRSYNNNWIMLIGDVKEDLDEAKKEIIRLIEDLLSSSSKLVARDDTIVVDEE